MPTSYRVAKGVIWCANFALDLAIILVVLILIGFGTYTVWDTQQIYTASSSTQFETYKPASDEDTASFEDLVAINPDVLGWLTIYGTGVDYPLVQGEDNDEYMNKTATGEFALGGAIFVDYSNSADFSEFNTIIYGHHMAQSEMFGDIDQFDDETYWNEHKYGNLYYGGRNHGLELFAMIDADAYDFTLYDAHVEDGETYLAYLRSIARYWRDEFDVSASDHIVMMSTCADTATNGRYVLFGKIVDNTYEDTFVTEPTIIQRTIRTSGSEGTIPIYYLVIALILVALLLLVILVVTHLNKARLRNKARQEERRAQREARRASLPEGYGRDDYGGYGVGEGAGRNAGRDGRAGSDGRQENRAGRDRRNR